MSFLTDHKQKFEDLDLFLKSKNSINKDANGGNSVLFSYPPAEEQLYIQEAVKKYSETAFFIDISKLLVKLIDLEGWEEFKAYYQKMAPSSHLLFYDKNSNDTNLLDLIIAQIEESITQQKIPFLIRTGSLYGTGIENQVIMEHHLILHMNKPLVIFYPSKIEDNNLTFLNFKPASRYRCKLVK